MAEPELTEMDLTLVRCLQRQGPEGAPAGELTQCLEQVYPHWDELDMRQGESITRLRGRGFLTIGPDGRLTLTESGKDLAGSD